MEEVQTGATLNQTEGLQQGQEGEEIHTEVEDLVASEEVEVVEALPIKTSCGHCQLRMREETIWRRETRFCYHLLLWLHSPTERCLIL